MKEDVHFAFDSSVLDATAQAILKDKAGWMKSNPDAAVTIEGNCDERGTVAYNLALGERRAESAKAFLVNMGISAAKMTTISYGEEKPLDPGHNEQAWAKNRRDHFVIK
jgi:peptidoglycan-associated lipoprotein